MISGHKNQKHKSKLNGSAKNNLNNSKNKGSDNANPNTTHNANNNNNNNNTIKTVDAKRESSTETIQPSVHREPNRETQATSTNILHPQQISFRNSRSSLLTASRDTLNDSNEYTTLEALQSQRNTTTTEFKNSSELTQRR